MLPLPYISPVFESFEGHSPRITDIHSDLPVLRLR